MRDLIWSIRALNSFFLLPAALLAAGLLAGCKEEAAPQRALPQVSYMVIKAESYPVHTELSGRTSPYTVAEVRPQVSGIIKKRLFTEGADVQEGQVLYQIDPSLYQAAFDSARANLMKAEANVAATRLLAERYRTVVKVNAVSKQEYDNAVAAYGQAKAEVAAATAAQETARINLEYTKVTAPVSGRIGKSSVTEGALVTQNQPSPLATVQQLDPIYVDVTQANTDRLRLRAAFAKGLIRPDGEEAVKATLKLEDGSVYARMVPKTGGDESQSAPGGDAAPNGQNAPGGKNAAAVQAVPIEGEVEFRDITVDPSTGVRDIRIRFDNPDEVLLPNMYVRAVLTEGVNDRAIFIPQKAVVRDNRGRAVVQILSGNGTLPEGVFNPRPCLVTLGNARGSEWLVTNGLTPGDKVLVEGLIQVQAAMAAKVPVRGTLAETK